jgi:hypothetical protein
LDGGGGLKVPASVLTIENRKKIVFHFLTIYMKTGKFNNCRSNGSTVNSTETQIKSVRALLAPPREDMHSNSR